MLAEELPRRNRDHPGPDVAALELLGRPQRQAHLRARGDQHHLGLGRFGLMHHIRATTHPIGVRVRIQYGQALAGQHDRSRTWSLDGGPPGSGRFVVVGGTEHSEPGNGSKARQVLNRWSVGQCARSGTYRCSVIMDEVIVPPAAVGGEGPDGLDPRIPQSFEGRSSKTVSSRARVSEPPDASSVTSWPGVDETISQTAYDPLDTAISRGWHRQPRRCHLQDSHGTPL